MGYIKILISVFDEINKIGKSLKKNKKMFQSLNYSGVIFQVLLLLRLISLTISTPQWLLCISSHIKIGKYYVTNDQNSVI